MGNAPESDAKDERAQRSLANLVRAEALRADAEERIRPDPARLEQGWTFRFAIESSRASDLVTLYESSGFEVIADPVKVEQVGDECADCRLMLQRTYVAIYTRTREAG